MAVGRRSTTIIWRQATWSLQQSHLLEPRVLIGTLKRTTGQLVRVVLAHMHHTPSVRERQWHRLEQYL